MTTNIRNYLDAELTSIYKDALEFVRIKTQKTVTFPAECPYSLEQLLDIDWLPNLFYTNFPETGLFSQRQAF